MKPEKSVVQIDNLKNHPAKKPENDDDEIGIKHEISDFGAFLHILKCGLGAGMLATPSAFKNAGLMAALAGTIMIGLIITHTTAMLIDCAQRLSEIHGKKRLSYADTAEYAFWYGFKGTLKRHAPKARFLANFFSFFTYYGINVCYVLLIAKTCKQVLEKYFEIEYSLRWYTTGVGLLIYPVSIARWMKFLVPFSALANTLLVVCLGMIFWEIFSGLPSIDSRPAVAPLNQWPIFLGTIFMGMEGIGIVMPVQNEMKNPRHLINKPGILYYGMAVVIALNASVGFFGYLRYGEECEATISLNLSDNWISEAVKITIAFVILFSFGLHLSISTKVVWDSVKRSNLSDDGILYYVIRSALIVGAVIIATSAPSLKGLLGLIGSVGFPMLGIFFPATIEIAHLSTNSSRSFTWSLVKDIILIMFSLFVMISGAYYSILEIMESS